MVKVTIFRYKVRTDYFGMTRIEDLNFKSLNIIEIVHKNYWQYFWNELIIFSSSNFLMNSEAQLQSLASHPTSSKNSRRKLVSFNMNYDISPFIKNSSYVSSSLSADFGETVISLGFKVPLVILFQGLKYFPNFGCLSFIVFDTFRVKTTR